jgi:hypothetical protein
MVMKRTRTRSGALRIAAVALALVSAGPLCERVAAQQTGPAEVEPPPFPEYAFEVPDWAPIPHDLDVVVLREDIVPGAFRILDVRLSYKVDEDTLAALANLLREADEMPYPQTYIVYYLPGMRSGDGGWATSHFLPELQVRVLQP